MFSGACGKKDAITGRNWGRAVCFYPNADKYTGSMYKVYDDSLKEDMTALIDASETIKHIWVYKCPLFKWQLTQLYLCHHFVVFKTNNWWWSIEKNNKYILIQRSKKLSCVRDFKYQTTERRNTPVVELSYGKGRKSMKELIEFLYHKNELNKKYDWIMENCQDFAKRIFDTFTEKRSDYNESSVFVRSIFVLSLSVMLSGLHLKRT